MKKVIYACIALLVCGCIKKEVDINQCQKNCTQVQGRLTTLDGKKPLKNIEMELIWLEMPNLFRGVSRLKNKTKTDNNGYFSFSIGIRDDELETGGFIINVHVDSAKYLTQDRLFAQYDLGKLTRDTIVTINNYLIPEKSYINWQIKNIDKIKPQDYCTTEIRFSGAPGTIISWDINSSKQKISVAGGQPIYIENFKRIDDVRYKKTDTLFLKPGETRKYIVDFLEEYPAFVPPINSKN